MEAPRCGTHFRTRITACFVLIEWRQAPFSYQDYHMSTASRSHACSPHTHARRQRTQAAPGCPAARLALVLGWVRARRHWRGPQGLPAAALLGTRPNISESHSEISTRVPFRIAQVGAGGRRRADGAAAPAHGRRARRRRDAACEPRVLDDLVDDDALVRVDAQAPATWQSSRAPR